MKQFDELTDAEVLDLTNDQIERYVDLACAHEGVAFLPPEPTEPTEPEVEPDRVIYVVEGVQFGNRSDAERVAETLLDCDVLKEESIPGAGWKHRRAVSADKDEIGVTVKKVWTTDHWDSVKNEMQEYEEAKRAYDRERKEYEEAADLRSEISEHIYGRIREASETQYRRKTLRRHYERYLELADGDESTAARFLADAHHDARDLLPELFNAAVPAEEDEAVPAA